MKKYLIYAMEGEKMCFLHALMNADQLIEAGYEVKLIIEGAACKLITVLEAENNRLYLKLKENGTIHGVCLACSKVLGVYEENEKSGIPFLNDMNGHAGVKDFVDKGYEVMVF
ncbi:MAG TPA: hypothetical protein GXZ74_00920 [Tissierellia bacterium]|nr:hypothetical protein [Tissierellia bacterium]